MPPYRKIGWSLSLLLIIYVFLQYQLFAERLNDFWEGFGEGAMVVLSATVLLMCALEIGILFRDYRHGYLFPMRNATFFIVCLSVLGVPLLALYEIFAGPYLQFHTLVLVPVFLWMCTQNLFRVRVDNVSFLAKMGFRSPQEIPLFRIAQVTEDERGIDVVTDEGKTIRLLRPFFFPGVWNKLRERLQQLG